MNQPKRHHYVPCMLLKHFTAERNRTGTIYPFEINRDGSIRWERKRKTPNGIAFLEFFYSVPNASVDNRPQIVEELLGTRFESKWNQVVQTVVETSRLPDSHDQLTDLIQFVAFSAIRTPRFKTMIAELFRHIGASAAQLEQSKQFLEKHSDGGIKDIGEVFEGLVEKSQRGFDQDDWIRAMVIYSPIILSTFMFRQNWTLYESACTDAHLICTDDPVTLIDREGTACDVSHACDPEKTILMPLSPKQLLSSERFSDSELLQPDEVAVFNTIALTHATRGFAMQPKFCRATGDGISWEEKLGH